mmetsp:Transcript_25002/g.43168  ORF Transcript_25002/g.43168 Transcript_25002/m.43168 type:complete len:274 (-) Transcript_25002:647-1468(-)
MRFQNQYKLQKFCMLSLILFAFFLSFTLGRFCANFFIILLQGSQILTGFREFTFLHTFTDVPVNEGTLGVHEIELVIDSGEDLGNGSTVRNHANRTLNLGQISTRDDSWWLIIDAALEPGRTPIDELNGSLCLDCSYSCIYVLGDDISSVHETASHVFAVTRIALSHHACGLEGAIRDFRNRKLLVVCLLSRNDRSVGRKHEVNARIWDKICLELCHVNVESTIETKRCCKRTDDLSSEPIQVRVGGPFNVEISSANIVNGLIVQHHRDIGVF